MGREVDLSTNIMTLTSGITNNFSAQNHSKGYDLFSNVVTYAHSKCAGGNWNKETNELKWPLTASYVRVAYRELVVHQL